MPVHENKGFTMIEVMLVVIIIGVLAAMIIPNFSGRAEQARVMAAKVDMEASLVTALDLYELDMGRYPTTDEGLLALVLKPEKSSDEQNWSGPYLKKKKIPKDPWGRDYIYVFPGEHHRESYDLSSLGLDGVESNDDIKNWE